MDGHQNRFVALLSVHWQDDYQVTKKEKKKLNLCQLQQIQQKMFSVKLILLVEIMQILRCVAKGDSGA